MAVAEITSKTWLKSQSQNDRLVLLSLVKIPHGADPSFLNSTGADSAVGYRPIDLYLPG
jgi:hypothetical protein